MGKRVSIILFSLLFSLAGFSQSRLSLNLNGGLDKNFNKYYSANSYSEVEDPGTDFSTGINLAYKVGAKNRLRLDMKYTQFSFGQEPTSSASKIILTEFKAYNMVLNPRFDILLFAKNKFELYVSPGASFNFLINNDQITTRTDGDTSYSNYIDTDYNNSMAGVIAGALAKYNITDRLGLTLSPDYTLYFAELYDRNNQLFQRLSLNFGIEWTL